MLIYFFFFFFYFFPYVHECLFFIGIVSVPSPTPEEKTKDAELFASLPSFMAEVAAERRALDLPSPTPAEEVALAGPAGSLESEGSEEQVDYGSPLSSYRHGEDVQAEEVETEAANVEPESRPLAGILIPPFFLFPLFLAFYL